MSRDLDVLFTMKLFPSSWELSGEIGEDGQEGADRGVRGRAQKDTLPMGVCGAPSVPEENS